MRGPSRRHDHFVQRNRIHLEKVEHFRENQFSIEFTNKTSSRRRPHTPKKIVRTYKIDHTRDRFTITTGSILLKDINRESKSSVYASSSNEPLST